MRKDSSLYKRKRKALGKTMVQRDKQYNKTFLDFVKKRFFHFFLVVQKVINLPEW